MKHPEKPCAECPFRRSCTPNSLGGSDPAVYVGQAFGPFFLPCHLHTDYNDPAWRQDFGKPQCAGAAVFRTHVDVARRMPPGLIQRPADPVTVFVSPAELLAHHRGVSLAAAAAELAVTPPAELLRLEIRRAACQ